VATDSLILIPTQMEAERLAQLGPLPGDPCVELCGFGPVAAAAQAARHIANHSPRRVLLVGIAGTYGQRRLGIGAAARFESIAMDGIGAGEAAGFTPAGEMGFDEYQRIPLARLPGECGAKLLMTVCAASADRATADARRERFPDAVAEDMEGYSVALACRLFQVPLAIVRGASNRVGERDHRQWKIEEALAAAHQCACGMLSSDEWEMAS